MEVACADRSCNVVVFTGRSGRSRRLFGIYREIWEIREGALGFTERSGRSPVGWEIWLLPDLPDLPVRFENGFSRISQISL